MEVTTARFLLRDFVQADRPAFLAYQADARNAAFYGPDEAKPEHAARLFETFQAWAAERPRRNYQFAIVQQREPHALVGCCGLRAAGCLTEEAEFGIELAAAYWGRHGYAFEVACALLDFGFDELKLAVISGSTVSANQRIVRMAEYFGAEVVTICSGAPWISVRNWSEVQWRITRERWATRKSFDRRLQRAPARISVKRDD
jgi:ribosomal-protein-alanine N-acetyltransferase